MIVLVDMDGVIVDWGARYDALLQLLDHHQIVPTLKEQTVFDLFQDRTPAQVRVIKKVMSSPHLYKDLKPMPGAIEALHKLDESFTVFIVSSPDNNNPNCASDKLEWVRSNLGEAWCSKLILTQDKTAVIGDVLIDDKPEVLGRVNPTWKHILFDANWNQTIQKPRILDWVNFDYITLIEKEIVLT